ncbi:MAG: transposase [Methylococcaceae bacterium]|nr:transposase [Methylococcaceae bacterium]
MNNLSTYPIGGIDYPELLQVFDECFSIEQPCLDYLQKFCWSDDFVCPACNESKAWKNGY